MKIQKFSGSTAVFDFSIDYVLNLTIEVTRKYFEPMKPEKVELNAEPVIGILAQARDSQKRGHPVQIVQYDSSIKLINGSLIPE